MTAIEWTDATWNPVVGCTPVSPGCLNCYAATMARRLEAMGRPEYAPRDRKDAERASGNGMDTDGPERTIRIAEVRGGRAVFTGDVRTVPGRLLDPLRWRKPRRVFVNSMSDLFHEAVPDAFVRLVFAAMSWAGQHTYQVLTKRPERMAAWFAAPENSLSACQAEWAVHGPSDETPTGRHRIGRRGTTGSINGTRRGVGDGNHWPLPNVWLGTSVEDQRRADERVPHLLRCPAAVRFLSCEPLLGEVDLTATCNNMNGIDWVIVGGESGPHARPCDVAWIRGILSQCREAGVPVFVKQIGRNPMLGDVGDPQGWPTTHMPVNWETGEICLKNRKGGDMSEWPEELRVREWPHHNAMT